MLGLIDLVADPGDVAPWSGPQLRMPSTRARPARVVLVLVLALAWLLGAAMPGSASAAAGTDAAVELAQTYAPVPVIDAQTKACGPGEAYRPTVVNLVLGNSQVVLRDTQGKVVDRAPTARELSNAPDSDYLDLPGDPINPGCGYEKQFRNWYGDRKPSVYAHVATDSEHPGKLAVQYWFYYTFNDFTDLHESDWEMAQVDFDAPTPEQALTTGPYQVDLAQHAGGERGPWTDDPKLSKQGTHPLTYVATGSHADYFQRDLYLGKGGTAIFGCDDTRDNTTRLHPQVVVLPDTPVPANSDFAWLNFRGRWGQKEPGINNGPYGPAGHDVWLHPITWADSLRTSSVTVPSGQVVGLSVTSFFCSATSDATAAFNWGSLHPAVFIGLIALVAVGLFGAMRRTTWAPPDPEPLRRVRGGGQILRSARRIYGAHLRTFIGIGLIFIPISALAGAVQWVLFHVTGIEHFVALDGRGGVGTAFLALLIGTGAAAIAAAAVTAAVSAALNQIDQGRRVTALQAYALAGRELKPLSRATIFELLVLVVLTITVIGIPFAIWGFVRTSFFAQVCVFERRPAWASLAGSARLTRGRWWRTFGFTALVDVLAIMSGPILGVILLLLTSQSLTFINLTGSIVYALTVPMAAIALTLYWFDLQIRPAPSRSRR
jgi:hypothetical protein